MVSRTQALGHDEHEGVEVCSLDARTWRSSRWSATSARTATTVGVARGGDGGAAHRPGDRPGGADRRCWPRSARTSELETDAASTRLGPLGPRRGAATGHHSTAGCSRRGGSRRARHDQRLRGRRRRARGRTVVTDGAVTAAAAKPVVTGLGGAFMISAEAKAAGKDGGYRGWQLYVTGRAGVLGEVSTEVVHAALGFHPPRPGACRLGGRAGGRAAARDRGAVRRGVPAPGAGPGTPGWPRPTGSPTCSSGSPRAADPAGWPLFAAWRAQPLPDDGPGRVVQLLHVLREHRGSAHLGAVRAAGLRPLEAIVAGDGGPGNAAFFGWPTRCRRSPRSCGPCWPGRRRPPTPRSDRRTPCSTAASATTCCGCSAAAAAAARAEA